MPENLLLILNNLSLLVLSVALLSALIKWRQLNSALRMLTVAMATMLAFGLITLLLWLNSINNLPVLHLYTVSEFAMLGAFYVVLAPRKSTAQLVVGIALLTGLILMVLNTIYYQPVNAFNSNARTLESLLLLTFAVARLFSGTNEHLDTTGPWRQVFFWVNAGVLVYFSASLIIFLFSNYTSQLSIEMSRDIWSVHAFFNLLFSSLLAVGMFKLWNPTPTSSD